MYNFEFTIKDMLLGMPFLDKFYPHIITKTHWWLTTPCGYKIGAKRVKNKQRKSIEWIRGSEKINQEMENISEKQISQLEIIIFAIDKVKIINEQLEQLYNEDPLQGWEKHKTKVKIELIDESSIITHKPLKYNFDDLKEFKIHINELLENNYKKNKMINENIYTCKNYCRRISQQILYPYHRYRSRSKHM